MLKQIYSIALILSMLAVLLPEIVRANSMQLENRRILVPCKFNEYATMCILDTGSFVTIPPNISWVKALPSVGTQEGEGVKGKEICELVRANVAVNNQFLLEDSVLVRCPNIGRDFAKGTIGIDVVGKFVMQFDFKNKKFDLLASGKPAVDQQALDLEPNGGQMLIPSLFGGEKIEVLWDTGIPTDGMVDTQFVRSHPNLFKLVANSKANDTDITGGVFTESRYQTSSLVIGGRSFPVTLEAVDLSHTFVDNTKTPIFLGLNAIQKANWRMDPTTMKWSFF